MRNKLIGIFMFILLASCVNAELKENETNNNYVLKLMPVSNDLVLTAVPGENVRFTLKVEGIAPLRNMRFYGGEKYMDISGVQNRTPPYSLDITGFSIDNDSPEETILCKVVAETNEGMFVTSNVVAVKVVDTTPPIIVKFEKEQSPKDSIYSQSPFSLIVEAQDLNSGLKKIEVYDEYNNVKGKYSEDLSDKYVLKRYSFVGPALNCGLVNMKLKIYDGSSQANVAEKSLLLKVNEHPFDEDAPAVSFISPAQDSTVSAGSQVLIKIRAEDDCSLVDKIHYYTSYDEQVYTIDVVNKKRVVEEEILLNVPETLSDGEDFYVYVWAEDTYEVKHGSIEDAAKLRLIASNKDIPRVTINSPTDNKSVSPGDKVSIVGTAISNRYQIKEVILRVSGSYSETRSIQYSPALASVQFNFELTIPSGLKTGDQLVLYVDAKDNSPSESVGTAGPVRLNVEEVGPSIQILSPSQDDVFYPAGVINTNVYASSSSLAVKKISYHIEGIEGISQDEEYILPVPQKSVSKIFSYKLPIDVMEGELFISAIAVDTSDREGRSETIRVRVRDNVKPIVTVISPPNYSTVDADSTVDLVVKAEDVNSFVAEVDADVVSPYTEHKRLIVNKKSDEVTFTFRIPDNLVSNQIITIQIYAIDDSSLSNKSDVIQWRLRVR